MCVYICDACVCIFVMRVCVFVMRVCVFVMSVCVFVMRVFVMGAYVYVTIEALKRDLLRKSFLKVYYTSAYNHTRKQTNGNKEANL